ncbi:hypothetical protein [Kineococcus sp. SYSU DK001]|uniref:hypothetical protein n=1 Tax=Kineococcus sp. SYSU DK001 TaxID=3383122 RepID=UPI003D7EFD02
MPATRPLGAPATLALAGVAVVVLAAGEFAWTRTDAGEGVAVLALLLGWTLLTWAALVAASTTTLLLLRRRRPRAAEVVLLVAGTALVAAAAAWFLPVGAGSGTG